MLNLKSLILSLLLSLPTWASLPKSHDPINIFVLLGLTRESGHWTVDVKQRYQSYFPNGNIILLDLPGGGKFYQDEVPKTLEGITDFVRENYSQFFSNQNQKNIIVATSLASMVAADWSIRYPKDFAGMVLVAPSFKGICSFFERTQAETLLKMLTVPFLSVKEKEEKILSINSNSLHSNEIIDRYVQIHQERPMSKLAVYRQTMAGKNYQLPQIPTTPALILGSEKDSLVHPQCFKKISREFNAPLALHPWAGHGLPVDDPDFIFKKTVDWLDRQD